jgi:hypothetical protein
MVKRMLVEVTYDDLDPEADYTSGPYAESSLEANMTTEIALMLNREFPDFYRTTTRFIPEGAKV